jgi:membrane-associated protein
MGVAKMRYRTFISDNIVGGILWRAGLSPAGYLLGSVGFVRDNVESELERESDAV